MSRRGDCWDNAAMELGVHAIERVKPGNRQQNGRHEGMHLTLKKEATKPPAKNFLQQAKFDHSSIAISVAALHGEQPPDLLSRPLA